MYAAPTRQRHSDRYIPTDPSHRRRQNTPYGPARHRAAPARECRLRSTLPLKGLKRRCDYVARRARGVDHVRDHRPFSVFGMPSTRYRSEASACRRATRSFLTPDPVRSRPLGSNVWRSPSETMGGALTTMLDIHERKKPSFNLGLGCRICFVVAFPWMAKTKTRIRRPAGNRC